MKSLISAFLGGASLIGLLSTPAWAQTETQIGFTEAVSNPADWREVDPDNLILFDIVDQKGDAKGRILIEAAPFAAPNHVAQFKKIIRSGDFDGTVFHRVIDDFMAQGGDVEMVKPEAEPWPNIDGEFVFTRKPGDVSADIPGFNPLGAQGTATYGYMKGFPVQTQAEFLAALMESGTVESWIPHCEGVVSTARTDDPNSADTQFFMIREASQFLDQSYTSWGRVLSGQDIVDNIKIGEPVRRPDVLVKAQIAADLPEAERPRVLVQRTDGPLFQTFLTSNSDANACDLAAVPTIVAQDQ